jgi:hypothetical protein
MSAARGIPATSAGRSSRRVGSTWAAPAADDGDRPGAVPTGEADAVGGVAEGEGEAGGVVGAQPAAVTMVNAVTTTAAARDPEILTRARGA